MLCRRQGGSGLTFPVAGVFESDGPERAPTTGTSQYGALLPGTVLSG